MGKRNKSDRFERFEAGRMSRSAVTRPEVGGFAPRINLPAANPLRRPTLIRPQALFVDFADWCIYPNPACYRFQFDSLPSLLFT
jgi:hypothetical protein